MKVIRSNDELNALANGKNLVANGKDPINTAGWIFTPVSGSFVVTNNEFVLTRSGELFGSLPKYYFSTNVGVEYEAIVEYDASVGTPSLTLYSNNNTNITGTTPFSNSGGKMKLNFVAIESVSYIKVAVTSGSLTFNNISVKEIPQVQGENLPDYVATRSNFGFKNYIINGGFDIWQRGTSLVGQTGGSFLADRWYITKSAGTPTWNVSKLIVNQRRLAKVEVTNAPSTIYMTYRHRVEDVRSTASKTMTLSFVCQAPSAYKWDVYILQNFGVGGSSNLTILDSTETLVNSTSGLGSKSITFNVPSVEGKSINDDSSYLEINIRFSNATNQVGDIYLGDVQLEEGSVATPFEVLPVGLTLSLCQRYYINSGGTYINANAQLNSTTNLLRRANIYFPTEMRKIPTISIPSYGAGWASAPTPNQSSTTNTSISGYASSATSGTSILKYTADSEL